MSANRGGAKIVGDGSRDAAWQNNGDYIDIVGFDITGPNVDGLLSGGSFVRIIDNSVHGFHEGNCITTANDDYDMHDIDVIGNIASHCGEDQLDHGIYVSHPRGIVANNIAYDNAGYRHPLLAQLQRAGHLEQPGFRQPPGRHRHRPGRRAEQRQRSPPTTSSSQQHRRSTTAATASGERHHRREQPIPQQHPLEQR